MLGAEVVQWWVVNAEGTNVAGYFARWGETEHGAEEEGGRCALLDVGGMAHADVAVQDDGSDGVEVTADK